MVGEGEEEVWQKDRGREDGMEGREEGRRMTQFE